MSIEISKGKKNPFPNGAVIESNGDLKVNSLEEEKYTYQTVETQVKYLQGKVLTVIDASFSDERQLKAVKDLINKSFSEQLDWIYELGYETRAVGMAAKKYK